MLHNTNKADFALLQILRPKVFGFDNNGTESRMMKNGVYFVDSTLGRRVIQHFDL